MRQPTAANGPDDPRLHSLETELLVAALRIAWVRTGELLRGRMDSRARSELGSLRRVSDGLRAELGRRGVLGSNRHAA
jgi:hypothetical protein